jgi:hypothetical protein
MPYLLCGTYQVELPEVKVASNMGKYTNALSPLWHLPSRIARIEGEMVSPNGSTLMSLLLCSTYPVEMPELKEKRLPQMG